MSKQWYIWQYLRYKKQAECYSNCDMRVSEEQQEHPVRMNRWSGKSESDKNKEVNRTTSYHYVLKQNNFIPHLRRWNMEESSSSLWIAMVM